MSSARGCSGLVGSPCLQGVLAALSDNPVILTHRNILMSQFACIRGEPYPCGQVAIFDTNLEVLFVDNYLHNLQ
jgi:hypothetical protein